MDLTGYLTINGTDLWTQCRCFLAETERGGHVNMDALLRMPKAKEITTVDVRERNGVELPDNPDVKLSSIERTLQFWLSAQSAAVRLQRGEIGYGGKELPHVQPDIPGHARRTGVVRQPRRIALRCAVFGEVPRTEAGGVKLL